MAKFVEAPSAEDTAKSVISGIEAQLATLGIETGIVGGGIAALGAVLLIAAILIGATRLYGRLTRVVTEGEVIDVEPGSGGGLYPVIAYRDAAGKRRQIVSPIIVSSSAVGMAVRLRLDGKRPRVVGQSSGVRRALTGPAIPLTIGAALLSTGLTGELLGLTGVQLF